MKHRPALRALGLLFVIVACCTIMGLAVHIVDVRNARRAATAAQVETIAQTQYDICSATNVLASELNAVLDYVKSFTATSPDPRTHDFIAGLPYATVPTCAAPK